MQKKKKKKKKKFCCSDIWVGGGAHFVSIKVFDYIFSPLCRLVSLKVLQAGDI